MITPVVFYPVLAGAFPYGSIHEQHAASLAARSLREQARIVCVLDHEDVHGAGSTHDGTLRLCLERSGLRAEVDVPDTTPAGRRLAAALAAGTIRGASFRATPRRVRWHLGPHPCARSSTATWSRCPS